MLGETWYVKRRRELEAAAPVKPKKKVEAFVKVPLWWIAAAAKAAGSPTTLVLVELLYVSWKARSLTFPLPNSRLMKLGVTRNVKRRVLKELERGGLIKVDRRGRNTPEITLTVPPA